MSAIHQSPARERINLAPASASRGPGPTLERQRAHVAWLFVAPMLVAVALVAAWPLGRTIAFSFTDAYLDDLDNWAVIGFANYISLFQDPLWWRAVSTTARSRSSRSVWKPCSVCRVDAERAHAGARAAAPLC
jgi:trehalose/maltose transport system permease protein